MFAQVLCAGHLKLYYTDTAREQTCERFQALSPWLEASLETMKDWLWSQKGLAFSEYKGLECVELQLTLCGNKMIQSLNRDYRGKDSATDVLSFQMHENLTESWESEGGAVLNLGDLFICREKAVTQAKQFELSFEEEVVHLFIHGFLHLCGYDHELGEREEREMQRLEKLLLKNTSQLLDQGERKWMKH